MRARGSGYTKYLTQDLSSLAGVVGSHEALHEQLGSVSEDTFSVLSHEPSSLRPGLSPSDKRLGVTPVCDEDCLVHKTSPQKDCRGSI